MIDLKICIIIPAHNEEKRIDGRFEDLRETIFKKYGKSVTLVIVDDGSKDKTVGVVRKHAKKYGNVELIINKKNEGKGGALINGFRFVCKTHATDIIGFVDADLSYSGKEMIRLIETLWQNKDVEGVIASRYMKGSKVIGKIRASRYIASRGYNAFVRILFGIKIKDTQAGCKFFRAKTLCKILNYMHLSDMCFDINLLYELKKRNYKVIEVPVTMRIIDIETKVIVSKQIPKMFLVTFGYWLTRTPLTKVIPNKWKGYVYNKLKGW